MSRCLPHVWIYFAIKTRPAQQRNTLYREDERKANQLGSIECEHRWFLKAMDSINVKTIAPREYHKFRIAYFVYTNHEHTEIAYAMWICKMNATNIASSSLSPPHWVCLSPLNIAPSLIQVISAYESHWSVLCIICMVGSACKLYIIIRRRWREYILAVEANKKRIAHIRPQPHHLSHRSPTTTVRSNTYLIIRGIHTFVYQFEVAADLQMLHGSSVYLCADKI